MPFTHEEPEALEVKWLVQGPQRIHSVILGTLVSPSPSTVFRSLLVRYKPPQTALSNSPPCVTLTDSVGQAFREVVVGRTGGFCSALAGPGWEGRGDSQLEARITPRLITHVTVEAGWQLELR